MLVTARNYRVTRTAGIGGTMGRVSNYLNFDGDAEAAFAFYAELFGTEPSVPISRYRDMPVDAGMPPLSDEELDRVLHVELPIMDGFVLMASDALPSLGMSVRTGNNITINLQVETTAEADRLYDALAAGDDAASGMSQAFFGYWGSCQDRFGVRWMVVVAADREP